MKMKKTLAWLLSVVTLCYFLSLNALAQDDKSNQPKHEPITQQLITMVEHNSEIKKMLVDSIAMAKKINPDKISSVNFEDTVKVGNVVKKGDMLGYFLFGGSDIVLLFQRKFDFELTVPKESDGTHKHVLMGEEFGKLTKKK